MKNLKNILHEQFGNETKCEENVKSLLSTLIEKKI